MPSYSCSIYPCDEEAWWRACNSDTYRLDEAWWYCAEHKQQVFDYLDGRALLWGSDVKHWSEG